MPKAYTPKPALRIKLCKYWKWKLLALFSYYLSSKKTKIQGDNNKKVKTCYVIFLNLVNEMKFVIVSFLFNFLERNNYLLTLTSDLSLSQASYTDLITFKKTQLVENHLRFFCNNDHNLTLLSINSNWTKFHLR